MKGVLYIVSSPIGNLKDITLRAIDVLKEVDFIVVEDTRVSIKLLNHYGISKPLIAVFSVKETERADRVIKLLLEGKNVAMLSDAGTPLISDPGYEIVRKAISSGIVVVPIPGPSAVTCAIVGSGLSPSPFLFIGFLPKGREKYNLLESLKDRPETLVFFESPHRILETLKLLFNLLGDRVICVAREMTKVHEEFIRGRISEVIKLVERRGGLKGEIVLVVEGSKGKRLMEDWMPYAEKLIRKGYSIKDVANIISTLFDISKRKVYRSLLQLENGSDE